MEPVHIGNAELHLGDCREVLRAMPAESVHCVVTSPPYWGLRDYGVDGQIGMETSLGEHIDMLVSVFSEVRRVLRPDGTVWLNYGDCYATGVNGRSAADTKAVGNDDRTFRDKPFSTVGGVLKPKDLCMMPARVALALQEDGWWIRSEIIWAKPNPMPESISDRPTSSHEKVYLLSRSQRYWYDADAVREPYQDSSIARLTQPTFDEQTGGPKDPKTGNRSHRKVLENLHKKMATWTNDEPYQNNAKIETGRNLRNVWTIATAPFPEAHFATFPEKLVEPCIKAGTSEHGCCPECGAGWVRVLDREFIGDRTKDRGEHVPGNVNRRIAAGSGGHNRGDHKFIGWSPSCKCPAHEPVQCVVLDPFGGSGTVGVVAHRLNRRAVLIELNPEYVEIARRRIEAATKQGDLFIEPPKPAEQTELCLPEL